MWTHRDEHLHLDRDIHGYSVDAKDGHIGSVDHVDRHDEGVALVVDTGFWIFGSKRIIPIGVVADVDHGTRTVTVNMTKTDLHDAPNWREGWSIDHDVRAGYDEYYRPFVWM